MNAHASAGDRQRLRVEIQGAVQGVGFRPFVYRLATALGLTGWVINDTQGVFIEAEGAPDALAIFLARLQAEKPPLALIQTVDSAVLPPVGDTTFEIRHSSGSGAKTVLVLPDAAVCPNCLREVLSPADRRHRYPFTNCTDCGPRFSIIEALPYDRPNTTMRRFHMCPDCQAEYEAPADRRFHAQPNACPVCGPKLAFYRPPPTAEGQGPADGCRQAQGIYIRVSEADAALLDAAAALREGEIVAVKGLGGFLLMADAGHEAAVANLRARKRRGDKPFALMVRDLDQARTLCEVTPEAAALLSSVEAPIVLLPRANAAPDADALTGSRTAFHLSEAVAPGNPYLGVMLPYTPLHHLLLAEVGCPLIATSGNLSDEPICTDETEAFARLGGIADAFLVHDRPIARHVDDSVAWIVAGAPRLLRRARGYAPLPVLLRDKAPTILAVGAHLKNTIALSVGRQVFISQHIGDLETPEAFAAFEKVIADFLQLYEAEPIAIAHDLHPDYLSTKWARADHRRPDADDSPPSIVGVQHHHAHLAACLAENQAEGPALGVTWDGTGYGADGTIWGGEFLLGDAAGFTRVAHLRPFRLPGGDAAVKEPRRAALALLWEIFGAESLVREDLAPVRAFRPSERRVLVQMLERGVNAPITTSAGRLFDGIAALAGLGQRVDFEGQAAMALEFAADPAEPHAYPFPVRRTGEEAGGGERAALVLDWLPLLDALLADLRRDVPAGVIAARFHNALVAGIAAVAQAVGCPRVALTGGCFQNRLLVERAQQQLSRAGFEVLLHRQTPPNDGGISLGQVAVAAARMKV